MKRAIERFGSRRSAFAKIGVSDGELGAPSKPLHPTNLHVNE
jgi:hypothetical protein